MSVWICRANVAESWGVLDFIWTLELNGTKLSNLSKIVVPIDGAKLMMLRSLVI